MQCLAHNNKRTKLAAVFCLVIFTEKVTLYLSNNTFYFQINSSLSIYSKVLTCSLFLHMYLNQDTSELYKI